MIVCCCELSYSVFVLLVTLELRALRFEARGRNFAQRSTRIVPPVAVEPVSKSKDFRTKTKRGCPHDVVHCSLQQL